MRPSSSRRQGAVQVLLAFLVFYAICAAQSRTESGGRPEFIHGTIVVVVSTRDGFVLAGDSQGSRGCKAAPGEYEKVFTLGKRSGIVVAGLIGSQVERDVASSIATVLHDRDERSKTVSTQPQATTAMDDFVFSIRDMMSLFDDSTKVSTPIAAASAVSINDQGSREWITLWLTPVRWKLSPPNEEWGVKVDHFDDSPVSQVVALGAGAPIVEEIISGGDPNDPNEDIGVKHYFRLKSEHRLPELTLGDGKLLAGFLVKAAISHAEAHPDECLGIGGDIQMLTITSQGVDWVEPLDKAKLAPAIPLYHVRISDSPMFGRIDGGQWVRTTVPPDTVVRFDGDADAIVSQPKFSGKCTFKLGAKAEERMPETAARLRSVFSPHCDVYRETAGGQIKLSEGAAVNPAASAVSEANEYGSLCDAVLKSRVKEFDAQLKAFGSTYETAEQEIVMQEWLAQTQPLPPTELNVMRFKQGLRDDDRWMSYQDEYQRRFVPPAVAIRHELIRRVSVPAQFVHPDGRTPFLRWFELANELDALADLLPDGKCDASQKAAKN